MRHMQPEQLHQHPQRQLSHLDKWSHQGWFLQLLSEVEKLVIYSASFDRSDTSGIVEDK